MDKKIENKDYEWVLNGVNNKKELSWFIQESINEYLEAKSKGEYLFPEIEDEEMIKDLKRLANPREYLIKELLEENEDPEDYIKVSEILKELKELSKKYYNENIMTSTIKWSNKSLAQNIQDAYGVESERCREEGGDFKIYHGIKFK
jgi:hypothetical protein